MKTFAFWEQQTAKKPKIETPKKEIEKGKQKKRKQKRDEKRMQRQKKLYLFGIFCGHFLDLIFSDICLGFLKNT